MRKYLALIVALTLVAAVTTYAKDIRRVMADKTMTAVTPSATSYIMASYSTATGWDLRRMADNSVVKLGGMDTTNADGTRYIAPYNTTTCPADGPVGAICTLPDGIYWYGTKDTITGWHLAGDGAYAAPMGIADLTDWPIGVSAAEVGHLDGLTDNIQTQIDTLVAGSGFVTTPTNSDSPCIRNQWSLDDTYYYLCTSTNTWGRKTVATFVDTWNAPTPDEQPDTFTFTDQPNVALNTFVYSDTVQINGLNSPAAISVTGGSYKIDSGSWVTTPGTISNGQWVSAGHTSAGTGGTTTNTTVTVGGLSDTFSSTTVITAGADYIWPLLDNAATNAVNASVGGVGATIDLGTTTTASVQTGTGFSLPELRHVKVVLVPNSSAWTLQTTLRYLGQAYSSGTILSTSNNAFSLTIASATTMKIYMNASASGTTFTVPQIDANQVDKTVVRLVYDGSSLKVYTGASEAALALRHTEDGAITRAWGTVTKFNGWGDSLGNEISDLKIWNSAVLP